MDSAFLLLIAKLILQLFFFTLITIILNYAYYAIFNYFVKSMIKQHFSVFQNIITTICTFYRFFVANKITHRDVVIGEHKLIQKTTFDEGVSGGEFLDIH